MLQEYGFDLPNFIIGWQPDSFLFARIVDRKNQHTRRLMHYMLYVRPRYGEHTVYDALTIHDNDSVMDTILLCLIEITQDTQW